MKAITMVNTSSNNNIMLLQELLKTRFGYFVSIEFKLNKDVVPHRFDLYIVLESDEIKEQLCMYFIDVLELKITQPVCSGFACSFAIHQETIGGPYTETNYFNVRDYELDWISFRFQDVIFSIESNRD